MARITFLMVVLATICYMNQATPIPESEEVPQLAILGKIIGIGGSAIKGVGEITKQTGESVKDIIDSTGKVVKDVIEQIGDTIIEAGKITDHAGKGVKNVIDGTGQIVDDVIKNSGKLKEISKFKVKILQKVGDLIENILKNIGDTSIKSGVKILTEIEKTFKDLITIMDSNLEGIYGNLVNTIKNINNKTALIIKDVFENMKNSSSKIMKEVKKMIDNLEDVFQDKKQHWEDYVQKNKENLKDMMDSYNKALKELIRENSGENSNNEKLGDKIEKLNNEILEKIKNLFTGIKDKGNEAAGYILEKMKNSGDETNKKIEEINNNVENNIEEGEKEIKKLEKDETV